MSATYSSGSEEPAVFIMDCDNTLLDNDALKADLSSRLGALLGPQRNARLWEIYEQVRAETGVVDYPRTIERFRAEMDDDNLITAVLAIVMDYPFAERLYPDALATLEHLRSIAFPTIVSDGDQVYQPLKIARSGLAAAVEGHVLVYAHKDEHLDEIMALWPAPFYVMVDDKASILAATKAQYPGRFVTVWVRQGHYGIELTVPTPAPDVTLAHIGDLRAWGLDALRGFVGL
jgi:FMN phosphatase YigB (HAD superfamily)